MPDAKQEKTEYLKARVDEGIKTDFEGICAALGIKPAEQLRKLVLAFIAQEEKHLGERVQIRVSRPETYSAGAWRVEIKLKKPEECPYPQVFPCPNWRSDLSHCDPEYRAAWFDAVALAHEPAGVLKDGVWRGATATASLSLRTQPRWKRVEQALRRSIEMVLDCLR